MSRKVAWFLVIFAFIFFVATFFTRSLWQPWFFEQLFPRQQKLEGIKLLVDLLNGFLALLPAVIAIFKFLFPEKVLPDRQTLDSLLPLADLEKIRNPNAEYRQITPWIDRGIVTTRYLQGHPFLVLVGRMKSGKTREAAELIRQALSEDIVFLDKFYDISESINELSLELIQSALKKILDRGSRVLFYLNEIPVDVTAKQLKVLDEYLSALNQCSPGYFVTTIRADHLENNNELKNWLRERNISPVQMKPLSKENMGEMIKALLNIYSVDWNEEYGQELIKRNDGTPYHLILTLQRLSKLGKSGINIDEIKRIASLSLEGIWIEISKEIGKREPASDSLLKALAIFHNANVLPYTELVFALAEKFERANKVWNTPWIVRSNLKKAANALKHYDVSHNGQFSIPDVAVEIIDLNNDPRDTLRDFLRISRSWIPNLRIHNNKKYLSLQTEALADLAISYYFQNNYQEAITILRSVISIDPRDAPAWSNLGVLLKEMGRLEEAEQAYRKAVEADPRDAQAWSNLGVLLIEQGQKGEAEQAYRKAVEADPRYAKAWYNLGTLYRILNRYSEAQDALEHATFLTPDKAFYHASLGDVHRKLDRPEEANQEFTEAQRLSKNESCYNRACIAALCGDLDTAFSLLQQVIANNEVSRDWILQDPDWEDARDDPRFIEIVEKG